jgi:DNA-binding transcriptional regulator GbsR (MarR family)
MTLAEDIEAALSNGALSLDELMNATGNRSRSSVCQVVMNMRKARRVVAVMNPTDRRKAKYEIKSKS